MQLYNIRGGNKQELLQKKYQIGVGISLGNKWFTIENINSLIKWSLSYSKDKVIVYVADSIHAINIEVRNRTSKEKSQAKADMLGSDILEKVKKSLTLILTKEEIGRLVFANWKDIIDKNYIIKTNYLYKKYKEDVDFSKDIHNLVKNFTSHEGKAFSDTEIDRMGDYIIEEMTECLCRVQISGYKCDAYAYPYDGELPKFIEEVQMGITYPEIKENIIDTENKVFLEVR